MVIIDHLPRTSHFRQAAADDEDWAREHLDDAPAHQPAPSVPLSEFSREVELLTYTVELLQALNLNVRALASDASGGRVHPLPRPVTALERLREQRRMERLDALVDEVAAAQDRWRATNPPTGT